MYIGPHTDMNTVHVQSVATQLQTTYSTIHSHVHCTTLYSHGNCIQWHFSIIDSVLVGPTKCVMSYFKRGDHVFRGKFCTDLQMFMWFGRTSYP